MKLIKLTKPKMLFKRAFIILFLAVFVILPPTSMFVNAEIINEEDASKESSGLFESILSKTMLSFANSLIGLTGAQDVSVLVYQEQEIISSHEAFFTNATHANKDSLVYGIFPEGIYKGIAIFYDAFNGAIPGPIVALITLGGFLLLLDVFKGNSQRSQVKEWLLGLVMAILAMNYGSTLWGMVIGLNDILVSGTYQLLTSNGIQVSSFISTIWNTGSTESIFDSKNLLVALIVTCACITTFIINYQYMLRMITLGVLIVMFPVVVVLLVMPSKRSAIGQWFNLFASNVFMQTAHAISLGLFFFFLKFAEGFDFWLVLVMFFGLPTVTDLVQRIVGMALGDGFGGGLGTSAKNISGASSIMGLAMLGKNMLGKESGTSSSKNAGRTGVDNNFAGFAISDASKKAPTSNAPIGKGIDRQNNNEDLKKNNFDNTHMGGLGQENKEGIGGINVGEGSAFNSSSANTNGSNINASPLQHKAVQYAQQMKQLEQGQKEVNEQLGNKYVPMKNLNSNETGVIKNGNSLNNANGKENFKNKVHSGLRNASKITGTGIVRMSEAARNNRSFKMKAKTAAVLAAAGAGFALSTMATGKGNTGMIAGAGIANVANKPLGSVADKATRVSQVGGEILQSKGQGQEALAVTKDRVGFKDSAQFADVKESQKIMGNLVGGRTGDALAKTTAKTVQYAGSKNVSSIGGFNPQEATKIASKKERLEQQHIPAVKQSITEQSQIVNQAETTYKQALENRIAHGRTPENMQSVKNAQQVLNQEKQKLKQYEVRENKMQGRLDNFYDLANARKEAMKLNKQKAL